jgi:endonuclease/exonuclease/phosphatase family metal-dependent hydrolase
VRLATLNVQHGRSPDDGRVDTGRLARALASLDADVLALQEVDRGLDRSHRTDQAEVAAVACGAAGWRFAAGGPAEGATGIALVSRLPVRAWREVRLPPPPLPLRRRAPQGGVRWGREDARVVLCARIEGPTGTFTVVTTHLSGVPGWGASQLRRLAPEALAVPGPLVLLGDLGGVGAPARTTGLTPLASAATYPAGAPVRQVDHVLGRGVRALGPAAAVALAVSDHRALLVEADLDG